MKIVIASDIHGSAYWCKKLFEQVDKICPDGIFLLGDLLYHGPRNDLPRDYNLKDVIPILNRYKGLITAVRGNCDAEVDQMVLDLPIMDDFKHIEVDGKNFWLTHGHLYKNPHNDLGMQDGYVCLQGHFHVPQDEIIDGVHYLNPGSVSIPKENSKNSFIVYDSGSFLLQEL